MFDKLQQLQKIRELQGQLAKEQVTAEREGCKVVINGKFEIMELSLNAELSHEEQEKAMKECANEAIKNVQMLVAQKMQQMGGLGV